MIKRADGWDAGLFSRKNLVFYKVAVSIVLHGGGIMNPLFPGAEFLINYFERRV
jgi:hypothetical protein